MQLIEKSDEFSKRFARWNGSEDLNNYPFIENERAPFTPLKRALPLLNIASTISFRLMDKFENVFMEGSVTCCKSAPVSAIAR